MGTREDLETLRLLRALPKITDPDVRRQIVDFLEAQVQSRQTDTTGSDPKERD